MSQGVSVVKADENTSLHTKGMHRHRKDRLPLLGRTPTQKRASETEKEGNETVKKPNNMRNFIYGTPRSGGRNVGTPKKRKIRGMKKK